MRLELTRQAGYAIRALAWLAESDAQNGTVEHAARYKSAAIAPAAGIPLAFAARVLSQLRHRGLLQARAGQQGGYSLARLAQDLSLLDVIEAVEGPLTTQGCILRDLTCGNGSYCVLHSAWSAAQAAMRTELARTSLAEVFIRL